MATKVNQKKKQQQQQQEQTYNSVAFLCFFALISAGVLAPFIHTDFWRGVDVGISFMGAIGLGLLWSQLRRTGSK